MFGGSNKKWKLFTVFGHDVYMTPWFLLLVALFSFSGMRAGAGMQALTNLIIWAPVLFFGILLHEFGHAFAIQAYGHGPSRIVFQGFGGVTINQRRGHNTPGRSIVISLAGPAVSFLLGFASLGLLIAYTGSATVGIGYHPDGLLAAFLSTMGAVNIFWGVFNLLPINPLDGGHVVLHGLRWGLKDRLKAMRYSAISSLAFLGLLVVGALAMGYGGGSLIFLLVLAGFIGMQNWRILQATNQRYPRGY